MLVYTYNHQPNYTIKLLYKDSTYLEEDVLILIDYI